MTPATWSVRLPDGLGEVQGAQAVGDAVVVEFARGVVVLDRTTGRKRWSQAADTDYYDVAAATAETVVVLADDDNDGEATAATGYDIDTGEQRFRRTYGVYTGDVALTGDLLLSTECRERVCELVATDLGSGREVWTARHRYECCMLRLAVGPTLTGEVRTTYNYVDPLRPPAGHVVAVSSGRFNDRATARTAFLDVRTGRPVGKPVVTPDTSVPIPVTDDAYLRWNQRASACRHEVSGYDLRTHRKLWDRTVTEWWTPEAEATCRIRAWRPRLVQDALLTYATDGKPVLVDLSTGEVTWTGTAATHPIGVDDGVAVAHHRPRWHVSAVDVTTSKRLWNDPGGEVGANLGDGTVASGQVVHTTVVDDSRMLLWTHDVRTGARKVCEGSNRLFGIGDGWLLGGLDGDPGRADFRYELRYFAL